MAQSLKIRKRFRSVLYQIVAIAIGILLVTPILYALVISFMPGEDILTIPPRFIPSRWITDNYKMAWTLTTLPRFMLNSLILAGVSSVVRVITASMAAFALSFFEFRGRNVIFMLIVLVSNYHTVSRLGWINTYMGMMIVFFVSANNIFMMRQYYLTFSKDLKEASEVDGCGNIRFFCTILLPLSTPIITTIFISSFISTWNTYLWPMLVTNDNLMRTVQVGVTMLNFPEGSTYGPVMAASMIVLLPTLAVFVIFRRQIVGGIMGGAVKG